MSSPPSHPLSESSSTTTTVSNPSNPDDDEQSLPPSPPSPASPRPSPPPFYSQFDTSLGLPVSLSTALADLSPTLITLAEQTALPPPTLSVNGLQHPLALPLLPEQAQDLLRLASKSHHLIPAHLLTFHNPAWHVATNKLFDHVCHALALPNSPARCVRLRGLLLCTEQTGPVSLHWHPPTPSDAGPGDDGIMVTCAIHLPSDCTGGPILLTPAPHDDGPTSLPHTFPAESAYNCFYTASHVNIPHQIDKIEDGYRLSLLYTISLPTAHPQSLSSTLTVPTLAPITKALESHIQTSPTPDWHFAFQLQRIYPISEIKSKGISALTGPDLLKVKALAHATSALSLGELDFVLVDYKSTREIYGDTMAHDNRFPPSADSLQTPRLHRHAYWGQSGTKLKPALTWIDHSFLSFETLAESPIRRDADEYKVQINCQAMAVVVWEREKRIEALSKCDDYDVKTYLESGDPQEHSAIRAEKILNTIRNGYVPWQAWDRTELVLEFCLEKALHEQASAAATLSATLVPDNGMHSILYRYVAAHGWSVVADAVSHYMTECSRPERTHKVEPLLTLFHLLPWVSTATALHALSGIMKVVECHHRRHHPRQRIDRCPLLNCEVRHSQSKLWTALLSVAATLERRCQITDAGNKGRCDELLSRIRLTLEKMTERDLASVKAILDQRVMASDSKCIDEFSRITTRRLSALRSRRFKSDAKFIMEFGTVGYYGYESDESERFRWESYTEEHDMRTPARRRFHWEIFVRLCNKAAVKDVGPSTAKVLTGLLDFLEHLSKKDIDALLETVCDLKSDSEAEEFSAKLEKRVREAKVKIYARCPDTPEDGSEVGDDASDGS